VSNPRSILVAALAAVVATVAGHEMPGSTAEPQSPEEVYAQFNEFCRLNFGAEKEPLVYEKFGRELQQVDGGDWRHDSERSATIAWETNLPAKGMVEYGTTPQYGSITPEPERHFYIHVYTLRGLEPATTYHYRTVSVDEQGHRLVSEDMTLTTRPAGDAIELPGELTGPPYVLERPGTYVLTRDVSADGTALEIMADDVTLDLGGHTVVYDNRRMGPIEGNVWDYFEKSAVGVRVGKRRLQHVRILGGTIRQGAGDDAAQANGVGFNPLVSHSDCTGEIAGLTVEYHGPQVRGLNLSYGPDYDLHHNVVTDRGTVITNRHQGTVAIEATPRVHHNLIKRARHRARRRGQNHRPPRRSRLLRPSRRTWPAGRPAHAIRPPPRGKDRTHPPDHLPHRRRPNHHAAGRDGPSAAARGPLLRDHSRITSPFPGR